MEDRQRPISREDIEIRFAQTDVEVVAIHRFLCVVAMPMMRCPLDPVGSLHEIFRVAAKEAAMMAIIGDKLVGTMGVMKAEWWYGYAGQSDFLTDRWGFILPSLNHSPVFDMLIEEAHALASAAGLEFIYQGRIRERHGKLMAFPRAYTPESATLKPENEDQSHVLRDDHDPTDEHLVNAERERSERGEPES